MQLYEVMFIVQPEWEGEALDEAIQRVTGVIENEKGAIVLLKKLGKRRLAYAIDNFREGSYVLLNVQGGKEFIPVLEHFFKVNEGYLRYIVIRLEKGKLEAEPEAESTAEPAEDMPAGDADVTGDVTDAGESPLENVPAEESVAESVPVEKDDAGDVVESSTEKQDVEPERESE